jgi:hypothetical protein
MTMKKIGTAWPTVIEIHNDYVERTRGGVQIVARVFTNGHSGEIRVLVPKYRRALTELFTRQLAPITGGGIAEGVHYTLAARVYEPWKRETIDYVIEHELARKSLRAEFVRRG